MATELLTRPTTQAAPDIPALVRGGRYVSLVGRFASMSRVQVGEIVQAHGGHYSSNRVARGTSLVVVGQKDWTLERDGSLPDALRVLRVMEARERVRVPVVSEEQFLEAIGLAGHAEAIHPLYTTGTLTELLGVSRDSVQGWVRAGLIAPARTVHGVWYFDFRQASAARTLCDLVRAGVSLKRMRKSLERLRDWMPEADVPLQQLAVLERDGQILVRLADGDLAAPDGQLHLDFEHATAPTAGEAADDTEMDEGSRLRIGVGASAGGAGTATLASRRSAPEWFDLAVEQHAAGFLEEAVASYREALLAGGPDARTCFDLGGALAALGRRPEATERYRQAVEIDPRFADAWNNLGTLLAETGRADDACSAFRRALSIDPDDARAHYNLADTLDEMGQPRQAAPHWRAFLRGDTTSPWAAHARRRLAAI